MNQYIFSPIAFMCALSALYSTPKEDVEGFLTDLAEEFVFEELPFDSVTESDEECLALTPHTAPLTAPCESEEDVLSLGTQTTPAFPLNDPLLLADQQLPAPSTPPSSASTDNTSFLSIGGTYTYVHLKPHGSGTFHGHLGGIQGLYEYRPCNQFYGSLKLAWRQGETEASGATRFLVDASAEERLGYTWAVDQNRWLWTLFSGLGYRYLGHHLKEPGNTLRFNYNEFYCPVGLFTDYQIYPWFSWGLHLTWMPQIFPTVTTIPLGGARWGITHSLGNTLAEMPLNFFAGKNKQFFLTLNPSFQYWADGHTTATTSTGEPLGLKGNTYYFWGVELSAGYAF